MIFRLAKICDLDKIASLQYKVRHLYTNGIFSSLDLFFLRNYYKTIINDPNSILVCGEDSTDGVVGFCCANLDVEKYNLNLKKNKFRLAFAALPSILKKPTILLKLISRFKTLNPKKNIYITPKGARLEYWVWSKKNKDDQSSIYMLESTLNIIKILGYNKVSFEVDLDNKKVLKFHKLNGALELNRVLIDDKTERVFMQYDFFNRKSKFNYVKKN
tara:strand:+ start:25404 stop:26051 length:648 start_codon:yes stop_codon:yes gene_type:complete